MAEQEAEIVSKQNMLEEVRERDRKVAELRRKHQVRANFRAAVKRSVIQYKFVKQMEESVEQRKMQTGRNKLITKEDSSRLLFTQGDSSDTANAIEKMLAKKKLERQMQKNLKEQTKSVAFDLPLPSAPKPAPSGDGEKVQHLFNDLGEDMTNDANTRSISERIRGSSISSVPGPPSSRPLSQRPPHQQNGQ